VITEQEVRALVDGVLVAAGEQVVVTAIVPESSWMVDAEVDVHWTQLGDAQMVSAPGVFGLMIYLSSAPSNPTRLRHALDQCGVNAALVVKDNYIRLRPAEEGSLPFTAPRPRGTF
jgi:hypothetical protein